MAAASPVGLTSTCIHPRYPSSPGASRPPPPPSPAQAHVDLAAHPLLVGPLDAERIPGPAHLKGNSPGIQVRTQKAWSQGSWGLRSGPRDTEKGQTQPPVAAGLGEETVRGV